MKKPCEVIKLLNSKTVQELSDTDFRAMCLRAPELSDAVNKVLYNEKVRREYKKRAQPYIQKYGDTTLLIQLEGREFIPYKEDPRFVTINKDSKADVKFHVTVRAADFPEFKFQVENFNVFASTKYKWKIRIKKSVSLRAPTIKETLAYIERKHAA